MDAAADTGRSGGGDEAMEDGTGQQKRLRRVSFADTTDVHFFDRDEDYETPPDAQPPENTHTSVSASCSPAPNHMSEKEEDVYEAEEEEEQEPFVRVPLCSSPGSSAASVTSNEATDDALFGPVSTSFIKRGRVSDSGMSEDNDTALDEDVFSIYFKDVAPLNDCSVCSSRGMETPTANSTTTAGQGSSMDPSSLNKEISRRLLDEDITNTRTGIPSSITRMIGDPDRYDYGKFSSDAEALLAEVNKGWRKSPRFNKDETPNKHMGPSPDTMEGEMVGEFAESCTSRSPRSTKDKYPQNYMKPSSDAEALFAEVNKGRRKSPRFNKDETPHKHMGPSPDTMEGEMFEEFAESNMSRSLRSTKDKYPQNYMKQSSDANDGEKTEVCTSFDAKQEEVSKIAHPDPDSKKVSADEIIRATGTKLITKNFPLEDSMDRLIHRGMTTPTLDSMTPVSVSSMDLSVINKAIPMRLMNDGISNNRTGCPSSICKMPGNLNRYDYGKNSPAAVAPLIAVSNQRRKSPRFSKDDSPHNHMNVSHDTMEGEKVGQLSELRGSPWSKTEKSPQNHMKLNSDAKDGEKAEACTTFDAMQEEVSNIAHPDPDLKNCSAAEIISPSVTENITKHNNVDTSMDGETQRIMTTPTADFMTPGSVSSMDPAVINKAIPTRSINEDITKNRTGSPSSISKIHGNLNRYDYGKHSPSAVALFSEVNKGRRKSPRFNKDETPHKDMGPSPDTMEGEMLEEFAESNMSRSLRSTKDKYSQNCMKQSCDANDGEKPEVCTSFDATQEVSNIAHPDPYPEKISAGEIISATGTKIITKHFPVEDSMDRETHRRMTAPTVDSMIPGSVCSMDPTVINKAIFMTLINEDISNNRTGSPSSVSKIPGSPNRYDYGKNSPAAVAPLIAVSNHRRKSPRFSKDDSPNNHMNVSQDTMEGEKVGHLTELRRSPWSENEKSPQNHVKLSSDAKDGEKSEACSTFVATQEEVSNISHPDRDLKNGCAVEIVSPSVTENITKHNNVDASMDGETHRIMKAPTADSMIPGSESSMDPAMHKEAIPRRLLDEDIKNSRTESASSIRKIYNNPNPYADLKFFSAKETLFADVDKGRSPRFNKDESPYKHLNAYHETMEGKRFEQFVELNVSRRISPSSKKVKSPQNHMKLPSNAECDEKFEACSSFDARQEEVSKIAYPDSDQKNDSTAEIISASVTKIITKNASVETSTGRDIHVHVDCLDTTRTKGATSPITMESSKEYAESSLSGSNNGYYQNSNMQSSLSIPPPKVTKSVMEDGQQQLRDHEGRMLTPKDALLHAQTPQASTSCLSAKRKLLFFNPTTFSGHQLPYSSSGGKSNLSYEISAARDNKISAARDNVRISAIRNNMAKFKIPGSPMNSILMSRSSANQMKIDRDTDKTTYTNIAGTAMEKDSSNIISNTKVHEISFGSSRLETPIDVSEFQNPSISGDTTMDITMPISICSSQYKLKSKLSATGQNPSVSVDTSLDTIVPISSDSSQHKAESKLNAFGQLHSKTNELRKGCFTETICNLSIQQLDKMEVLLNGLEKYRKYASLYSELHYTKKHDGLGDMHKKRLTEVQMLQDKLVFDKARLQLKREKMNKLHKRAHLLKYGIQECEKLKSTISQDYFAAVGAPWSGVSDCSNLAEKHAGEYQEECSKMTSMKGKLEVLDRNVRNSMESCEKHCKFVGYASKNMSCEELIKSCREHLEMRTRCLAISKETQTWELTEMVKKDGQYELSLNYHDFLVQRFTISTNPASLSLSSLLKDDNITKRFPTSSALLAFKFIFKKTGECKVPRSKYLLQITCFTSLLLGNLLEVLDEIEEARIRTTGPNIAVFHSPSASQLQLQLCFMNFKSGRRVTLDVDMSDLNCAAYPSDPSRLKIKICEEKTTLQQPILEDILVSVQSFHSGRPFITRLCECISRLVQSSSTQDCS